MVEKIIVADASPLIAFGRIKRFQLLVEILGTIIVPISVLNECLINPAQSGAKEIIKAIDKKLIVSHDDPAMDDHKGLLDILGKGEANAIVLAAKLKAGLLIDEKLGRKAAQKMNIRVIGTAGVLLLAKENKLIKKIAPLILELKNTGYYLSSELINTILIKAKEV